MKQNETKIVPKSSNKYCCKLCDYNTCRLSQYERHLNTSKHKNIQNETNETSFETKNNKKFQCKCLQIFNSRTTLWRHNKTCKLKDNNTSTEINIEIKEDMSIIQKLFEENKEFKKIIMDQTKTIQELAMKVGNTINTNSNNTINKKTFNLNFFLNETCKDALNMTDFVNSIQIHLKDLENTATEGYVNGISNIIIRELKDLDINKRPIHCSDIKRETLYIKDNNSWIKENEEKDKIKKVIKEVSNKNIKQIPKWIQEHPHFSECNHKDNDMYLNLIMGSMNGSTKEEQEENINKIIKNLTKEVVIEK